MTFVAVNAAAEVRSRLRSSGFVCRLWLGRRARFGHVA